MKVSYIIFIMIPLPASSISSHHLSPGFLQYTLTGVSACNLFSLLHTPETLIFLKCNFCHIIPLFKSFQWLLVSVSRYSSDYYPSSPFLILSSSMVNMSLISTLTWSSRDSSCLLFSPSSHPILLLRYTLFSFHPKPILLSSDAVPEPQSSFSTMSDQWVLHYR